MDSKKAKIDSSVPESYQATKIWTPSNIITLFRICLVPVFIVALISPWPTWLAIPQFVNNDVKAWVSALIFIVISCTDWVDGYLARSRNEVTDFGKFLDPLADKILVTAALIALVELGMLPSWPALVILTREFIVSGIRMIAASKGYVIAASWYGKAKTVLQIIAIVLFIIKGEGHSEQVLSNPLYDLAWVVMFAAITMTVISMLDYIAKAKPILFPSKSDEISLTHLQNEIDSLSKQVVSVLLDKNLTIGTAESLTGGLISASITNIPNSSNVIKGACVTYTNEEKMRLLDVSSESLNTLGAVSKEVAEQMAKGAIKALNVDISVAVTGVAGPSGGSAKTPIGTVFMSLCRNNVCNSFELHFSGDRSSIRLQTTATALRKILEIF